MKFTQDKERFVSVPEIFLKEYICDAPPEYVKVYLFGLYLAQYKIALDDIDLEDKLHLSMERIEAALGYWQKKGFAQRDGEFVRFVTPGSRDNSQDIEVEEPQPEQPNAVLYEKAEYNKILNKLLGRNLTHTQLQKIYDFTDVFKLPESIVISMIEHCVTVKGSDVGIAYLDKVAKSWADNGVTTPRQAQAQIDEYNAYAGGAKKIMKHMGFIGKLPGTAELEYYEKWTKEWGFRPDAILCAMKGIEFASLTRPFKYLDEILRSLKEKGALTASGIQDLSARENRERGEIKEILNILSIKGGAADSPDYREYYEKWRSQGIDHEIVIKACRECVKKGSPKPGAVDRLLDEWFKSGITTGEKLSEHLKRRQSFENLITAVYNKAGIEKQVGEQDIRLCETLLEKYQMSQEVLFFAAELSAANAGEPYTYFKKVLRVWAEKGIKTIEQAKSHDKSIRESKKPNSKPGFAQREFDEAAEKKRRIMEMLKEGERINAQQTDS